MTSTPFNTRKPVAVTDIKDTKVAANLPTERLVGMTFNMPKDWHREFKMTAVIEGISMHELLLQCFETYKKKGRS